MARNILNRVIQAAIVMLGVALLIFIMLRIVPGNAIVTMMGEHAKLETIERMTRELGLDQPSPSLSRLARQEHMLLAYLPSYLCSQ